MRPNRNMTAMSRYGIRLYSTLEAETGLATGWRQCGASVTSTPGGGRRSKPTALAHSFGVACHLITRAVAGRLYPMMRTDDLQGRHLATGDGPTSRPVHVAGQGARNRGVRIHEGVQVTGVIVERSRVAGVRTAQNDVRCSAGELRGPVGTPVQTARRRERAASRRALLHRHRQDRRRAPMLPVMPIGQLHLLQRRRSVGC